MGLVALVALYGLSAVALAFGVRVGGRRAHPAAAVLLALLPVVFTAEGFLPQRTLAPTNVLAYVAPWADPELIADLERRGSATNPLLLDPASQMIPWERAARDGFLFNPAAAGGSALLGNGQSAVLFPTDALGRLIPPFRAVTYRQASRLLVAVWGMFVLGRVLARGELSALAGAAVFAGSGFLQLWRLHPHSNVAAVAPWIVAAGVAFVRRPNRQRAILLGLSCAAGALGGHAETLLHVVLFTALVAPLLARGDQVPSLGALLRWGACAVLLAALVAAPALLPFVENLRESVEWRQFRGERHAQSDIAPPESLTRLRPTGALLALGDPLRGSWSGPENLAELGGAALGAPALLLVLLGLGAGRRAIVLFVVGVVGLLVSAHVPIISAPFDWVPLLRDSLLKRLGLWWVLAGAVLAAGGVERARSGERPRTAVLLGAALLVAVAVALAQGEPSASAERARILGLEYLPLLATLAALALMKRRGAAGPRLWGSAMLGLIFVALIVPRGVLFSRWVPVVPSQGFFPRTPPVEVLDERLAALPAHGYRIAGTNGALAPSAAAFYGFEDIRANDPLTFAPYAAFLGPLGGVPRTGWINLQRTTGPVLDFLGVRYVIDRSSAHRQGANVLVYRGPAGVVWERPGALPRAFFPRAVRVAPHAAAIELAHGIEDLAALAIVNEGPASGSNTGAQVLELEVGRGEVRATVAASAEAVLATSQPAIPGWRLRIDGTARPDAMRRINGAFLGALVPSGEHEVVFSYRPRSWTVGVVLASIGLVLTAALARSNRPRAR